MSTKIPQCPSVQSSEPGAQAFAVVGGSVEKPEVRYLDRAVPVTPELRAMTAPLDPAEVFRISGPCAQSTACAHWDEPRRKCRLAIRTVKLAPVVVSRPPPCAIRRDCVWWNQEGISACLRCPQVVTNDVLPNERVVATADPRNIADAT